MKYSVKSLNMSLSEKQLIVSVQHTGILVYENLLKVSSLIDAGIDIINAKCSVQDQR